VRKHTCACAHACPYHLPLLACATENGRNRWFTSTLPVDSTRKTVVQWDSRAPPPTNLAFRADPAYNGRVLENNGSISDNLPGQDTSRKPRRWIWFLLAAFLLLIGAWLPNVSRPGSRVEGCPEGCATAAPRSDGPLRVLSLNMLHGFPRFEHLDDRLDLIAAEIQRLDPDIVCLQEVPWHWGSAAQELAERTGLNYLYMRANGNRWAILFEEGEAILSRYPLRDTTATGLAPRDGLFEHRVALQATAATPWGDLRVISTHLTHGDPAVNEAQAASLSSFATASNTGAASDTGGTLAVVAGDFNAREDSPQIQSLLAEGWIDTYRAAHPDDPGATSGIDDLTDPEQILNKRIDYIFLVPGERSMDVVDSRVIFDQPAPSGDGWLWASDHAGLLTTLSGAPAQ
jgi:endonuclease/exonuclease/phosphatase family metal-dependent hydrolase